MSSAVILTPRSSCPAAAAILTIFPAGTARPLASDLNYASGEIRANLVVVKVGTGGKVSLYTSASAHFVFDVAGWISNHSRLGRGRGASSRPQRGLLTDEPNLCV